MIKKLMAFAVVASSVFSFLPSHATTVTKTILAPTAASDLEPADDSAPACTPLDAGCEKAAVSRAARCAYLANSSAAQDGTTGKLGYVFSVSSLAGSAFSLKPAAGSAGDFDVTFYIDLGTCEGQLPRNATGGRDPQPASSDPEYDNFSHHKFGNEAGTIPTRAKYAIVTLFGDANKAFTFTA